jgi:alanine-glyoxylate transaminase / serine-glyoxylate transaminase / serine-pyruvate transaminase
VSERDLLMIPGPIVFDPAVLRAMSKPTESHVAPAFIELFGRTLEGMRDVFLCPHGQPFVMAGSGSFAMDMAAANLIEPGDKVLVLSTGYFGDRFAAIAERYGAQVTLLSAAVGDTVPLEKIEASLKSNHYRLLTVTHVDTSTGVVAPVKAIAALASQYGVLSVADGVCATAGEECRQEEWKLDVYFTASQKAIGVPPGLALLMVSARALDAFKARGTPVASYYADFANWLPVMQAYEQRKPSYYGTPAVNLIYALDESIRQILSEGMATRFRRHQIMGKAFKAGLAGLGLREVPVRPEVSASTLSAAYYPHGVDGAQLLAKVKASGIVLAGGLLPEIKAQYFRIGHMGAATPGDILATIAAIEKGLSECNHPVERGWSVSETQKVLSTL